MVGRGAPAPCVVDNLKLADMNSERRICITNYVLYSEAYRTVSLRQYLLRIHEDLIVLLRKDSIT